MVGLDTDHRRSLAQNPVLLAGQIAILLASCNRDVARLRKRRQVAALVGLEVAQRPHSVHYTIISRNPTTRTPPLGSDPETLIVNSDVSAVISENRDGEKTGDH